MIIMNKIETRITIHIFDDRIIQEKFNSVPSHVWQFQSCISGIKPKADRFGINPAKPGSTAPSS